MLSYVPMDCSPSGSSVHGISQARILDFMNFLNRINAEFTKVLICYVFLHIKRHMINIC